MDKNTKMKERASSTLKNFFQKTIADALEYKDIYLNDKKIEALHQYRVNIRRIHSVLVEFKECIHHEVYDLLKTELKILVKHTNNSRDLDVFLENIKIYKLITPYELKGKLHEMEERLKQKQNSQFDEIKKWFESKQHKKNLQIVNDIIKEDKYYLLCDKNDISAIMKKNIKKRIKSIKKRAQIIIKKHDMVEFHKIRLTIKKLRYSIEGFKEFNKNTEIKKMLLKLQELQKLLGDVCDKDIEIKKLKELQEQNPELINFLVLLIEKKMEQKKEHSFKELQKLSL